MNSVENKRLARVKYLARNVIEKSDGTPSPFVGMEDVLGRYGRLVSSYEELEDKSATDSLRTQPGDVLFGKLRPYLAKSLLLEESASCTGEFLVMRAQRGCLPRYLYYLTLSEPWLSWAEATSYGSKMPRTSWELMSRLEVPELTEKEQSAIADFLDRETAKIDALIAKQEQLIATLREDRIATITHAVTKGLDPNAEMKDSGVEWLGEIPAHWIISRFSRHVAINEGQVDPRLPEYSDMPLIAPNHIESGTGRLMDVETASEQGADSGKYYVRRGQVIYSKIRPNLAKAVIAPYNALCSADMYGLEPDAALLSTDYLFYQILSKPFTDYAVDSSMRVAMPKVNRETLGAAPLWLPPVGEQRNISAFLAQRLEKLDRLQAKSRGIIEVLREYRSALITDAVTGKIDVRGAA